MGMMFSLNKKENKEYQSLQNEMKKNEGMKKLYKEVNNYLDLINKKVMMENNIKFLEDENNIVLENIVKILEDSGYVTYKENNLIVLEKGVIASKINECNSLIFTEIITSGLLDSLNEVEIASLMSIFLEDKNDDDTFKGDLYYSSGLTSRVTEIEKIVSKFISLENKYKHHSQDNFWKITVGSLDATYLWASGGSISQIKSEGLIGYEGNFIRNMTKLYNIINDITEVCTVLGKVELLPKLEKIPQLIIRDIVNLSSLYFI